MPAFYTINRLALLLRPSAHMTEWLNSLDPEDPIPYDPKPDHDDTDIYLLPEMGSTDDALVWLRQNFLDFFEASLENWCADEDEWPEEMDWPTFERFFDYSIQSEVIDTVSHEEDEALSRDYDDDDDFDLTGEPDADDEEWEG
ncbi:MAG: hypothetical protein KDC54_22295 [Lewinella sp.]|nr:hypothetical protein [Lewinella sp.]